jgi:hypothetical protein
VSDKLDDDLKIVEEKLNQTCKAMEEKIDIRGENRVVQSVMKMKMLIDTKCKTVETKLETELTRNYRKLIEENIDAVYQNQEKKNKKIL